MSTEVNTSIENTPPSKYWQTLEQWQKDPEFQKLAEQEFLSSPYSSDEKSDSSEGGWARREFLKLMGASLALTSFGCIRRPATKIVPYVKRPAAVVEGLTNEYASTFVDGSETFGVVVLTREGRPIHVTGNKLHPINGGGMSARAHAHILSLYDPGRLSGPIRNLLNETKANRDTVSVVYEKADAEIAQTLKKGKVAILTGSVVSPSLNRVLGDFARAANADVYTWDAGAEEAFVRAQEISYGSAVAPRLAVDKAKVIVAVNNDFLGTFLQPTEQGRLFARGRRLDGDMNRLVVFESLLSLTGSNADSRYRIRPSDSAKVILGLLHELLGVKKVSSAAADGSVRSVVESYADVESEMGLEKGTLAKVADELWTHRGRSLVLGGNDVTSQVAANLLNSVLGNDGVTIDYRRSPNLGFQGSTERLNALIKKMKAGDVRTLIVHGVNPGYTLPESAGFVEGLRKVELAVYSGDRNDETGRLCNYVLPDHHPMEGWSDCEGQKGVYSVQQPTLRPMGNTRGFGDTLIALGKAAGYSAFTGYKTFYDVVRSHVESRLNRDWNTTLKEGVVDLVGSARNASDSGRSFRSSAVGLLRRRDVPQSDFELVLYTSIGLKDGTLANVPWLQEFSDPVSKICWDNYLCLSPKVAANLHLKEGQLVKLNVGDQTLTVPTHVQPGLHDRALGLAVGYGRTAAGAVGNGVGVNAYRLGVVREDEVKWGGIAATITPTMSLSKLASTQGHHTMMGRQIVVEATLAQYQQNPEANIHRHKIFSAWDTHEYKGHKWGMSIDLNLCTGCSSCVIACQSENNIPTVGKKYVLQGRIMHWLRIDRYYVGEPNEPDVVTMPMLCQHCDNAPCETVCPVAATVHSEEGTNDMIYNRCVGTRYCANNCPYKVRRFNWFNYARMMPDLHASPMEMALNPDVTVRERGVMEKCTFCVQRIKSGKSKARAEGRQLRDGEVVTACQASCPTQAIVFGDINDPESEVSKRLLDKRHYTPLEELNTRPPIRYATKIRNVETLKGGAHDSHGKGGHA